MEVIEAIRQRRAVREYTDQLVDRAVIERLIGEAILAPSAMNLQPWAFAVQLDRKRISEYAQQVKDWLLVNSPKASIDPRLRQMMQSEGYSVFHDAPALVLVLAKSSQSQASEDCCLAAENFMLAARDEGIGTCCIGLSRPWLNLTSTKDQLGLPRAYEVVIPIAAGYPKAWPDFHGRNPAVIHWL